MMPSFQTLGYVTHILLQTERRIFQIGTIEVFLSPAMRLNQITIAFDGRTPTGYLTWAYLSDEVLQSVTVNPERILHITEWNEGVNLCFMDCVILYGSARRLLKQAKAMVPQSITTVHRVRQKGGLPPRLTSVRW